MRRSLKCLTQPASMTEHHNGLMIENFQEDSMKMQQTDFGFSNEATQFRAVPNSHNARLLAHV